MSVRRNNNNHAKYLAAEQEYYNCNHNYAVPVSYETGTGFSITPDGAIGFAHDIESKLSSMGLSAETANAKNNVSTAAAAAPAAVDTGTNKLAATIKSNRDAFERMEITCESIAVPAGGGGDYGYDEDSFDDEEAMGQVFTGPLIDPNPPDSKPTQEHDSKSNQDHAHKKRGDARREKAAAMVPAPVHPGVHALHEDESGDETPDEEHYDPGDDNKYGAPHVAHRSKPSVPHKPPPPVTGTRGHQSNPKIRREHLPPGEDTSGNNRAGAPFPSTLATGNIYDGGFGSHQLECADEQEEDIDIGHCALFDHFDNDCYGQGGMFSTGDEFMMTGAAGPQLPYIDPLAAAAMKALAKFDKPKDERFKRNLANASQEQKDAYERIVQHAKSALAKIFIRRAYYQAVNKDRKAGEKRTPVMNIFAAYDTAKHWANKGNEDMQQCSTILQRPMASILSKWTTMQVDYKMLVKEKNVQDYVHTLSPSSQQFFEEVMKEYSLAEKTINSFIDRNEHSPLRRKRLFENERTFLMHGNTRRLLKNVKVRDFLQTQANFGDFDQVVSTGGPMKMGFDEDLHCSCKEPIPVSMEEYSQYTGRGFSAKNLEDNELQMVVTGPIIKGTKTLSAADRAALQVIGETLFSPKGQQKERRAMQHGGPHANGSNKPQRQVMQHRGAHANGSNKPQRRKSENHLAGNPHMPQGHSTPHAHTKQGLLQTKVTETYVTPTHQHQNAAKPAKKKSKKQVFKDGYMQLPGQFRRHRRYGEMIPVQPMYQMAAPMAAAAAPAGYPVYPYAMGY